MENLDLPDIFQVPDPENPVIYEQPSSGPEDGEDFKISSDAELAFVHFPRGTKITKFVDKEPATGIVLRYNEDATTYMVMFPGGRTEEMDHEEVRKLYNPIIEQKDATTIDKEIDTLADLDVGNPIKKLDDMGGKSFLMDIQEDRTPQRATIVQLV